MARYRSAAFARPSSGLFEGALHELEGSGDQPAFDHSGSADLSAAFGAVTKLLDTDEWDRISQTAFGASGASAAVVVRSMESNGWPAIRVVDSATLKGANAAYSLSSDTILVSQAFLSAHSGDPAAVQGVLIEELGHAIDARLNTVDSPGDEGAIFSALVTGHTLSPDALAALKLEDDHGFITVDGITQGVEFSGTYGNITVDGSIADWTAADRIDTTGGTAGYQIYAKFTGSAYVFAMTAPTAIGANTTAWLNTDLNSSTGYKIFGFAGGAEYNINFDAAGTPSLYSGAAGQTLISALDFTYSADKKIVEFAIPTALIGSPTSIATMFDFNDNVYVSNDYSNIQYVVSAPPPVTTPPVVGSVTLDGSLGEWAPVNRIDTTGGTAGYEIYAKVDGDNYIFAIKSAVAIGANTTAWLNTDRNAATGYKIFGSTGGAEYNINFNAAGTPALFTGAAGQTPAGAIQYGFSADHKIVEFAVAKSAIGSPSAINALFDINDSVYLSNDYANIQYTVSTPVTTFPVVGTVTLDGSLTADWSATDRIDASGGVAGYEVYGKSSGDSFVMALKAPVIIGANTTVWINSDHNASTGYQVFGSAAGAEYAIEFDSAGAPKLYSVNATTGAETLVNGALLYGYSADKTVVEFALPKANVGTPLLLDVLYDINNTTYLPQVYSGPQYEIVDTAQLPVIAESSKRVAIVYSATTAANYFSSTAYSQLFMAAQNQAIGAGIPYDVLSENDLTNIATVAKYDAIVFPSFRNVQADKVQAITDVLKLAVEQYHIGLITAGDFMTNNATNGVLAGDPYARMKQFFDLTREGGGSGPITLNATNSGHPVMDGYTSGETVHSYDSAVYSYYQDATPGTTAPTVLTTQTTGGVTQEAVVATSTNGNRNVHFATESFLGDNNQLQHAIQWSVEGAGVTAGLQMSREKGIFASRNDMDQSQYTDDVSPVDDNGAPLPGIYDKLIPLLQQWKAAYNFVGSYYVNVGDSPALSEQTVWAKSLPYYQQILALGNEIGSHSLTHLVNLNPTENTNILTTGTGPGTFDYEFNQSKIILQQMIGAAVPGYTITGAAVPGATETLATAEQIIQYYNYISGGYSGVGAGYPGAIGYLQPGDTKVYIAPNIKFDFTLVQFQGMSPAAALAEWNKELADIASHADVPVFVWPWHDYGAAAWQTPGDPVASPYTSDMFTQFIASAAAFGSEFVTLDDLARRTASLEKATVDFSVSGNVVTASVISSDAGKFALDLDGLGTQKIASVANWFAYDDDSVFTARAGGTFSITLGATQTDVTHITKLPMRAELVTLTGDGTNLTARIIGEGQMVVDLKLVAGATLAVTGASIVSQVGDILTLNIGANGQHDISIQQVLRTIVTGTANNDTLTSTVAGALIQGLGGNDTLNAGAINQTLDGGIGNDTLNDNGFAGTTLIGGAGNDIFVVKNAGTIITELAGGGTDTVQTTLNAYNAPNTIESVVFTGTGNFASVATAAAQSITGKTGADTLGDGGYASVKLIGGGGADIFNVSSASTVITESANNGSAVQTTLASYTLPTNVAKLVSLGTANATLTGNTLANTIVGGAGDDRINGGAGFDTLTGGAGKDTFVFSSTGDAGNGTTAGTRDTITDFTQGQDKIDLSPIDANTALLAFGDQAFTFLPTAGQAITAAAQVHFLYQTIGGIEHTIIEGNVNSVLTPDFRIDLVGHIALTANDFIL